jgi:hypothetical protein
MSEVIQSRDEGRYWKAYMHYLAGLRQTLPGGDTFGSVSSDRRQALRLDAEECAVAISGEHSRVAELESVMP